MKKIFLISFLMAGFATLFSATAATSLAPSAPQYHTDKMDAKVRRVPQDIRDGVFKDPKANLNALVTFLTKDVQNNFQKVKILHDWLCDNIAYDADVYFSGRWSGQDYVNVLKKKKAVCSGYANCLNQMCAIVGIEAKAISGFSKDYGFKGTLSNSPDHAWNAVKLNGKWYLVDVTWDAGYMDYKTYIKHYSTQYLFWDARTFLYSHLAEKDEDQFYDPPITKEQFVKEPKIEGKFFQKGLSLADEKLCYSNETDGEFQVKIKTTSNVFVTNNLLGSRNFIEGATWTKRQGNNITLCYDVPDTADYEGAIYVQSFSAVQPMISIPEFEGKWLPTVAGLFSQKKITAAEKEFFEASYFKVAENGRYYLYDDQFATQRNNALSKIAKLVEPNATHTESVLNFKLKAAPNYQGFGSGKLKYPYCFVSYSNATNTELLEPITGSLKAGATQKFEIRSKNFASFAFIIDNQWHFFTKNPTTGNYELELEIPKGLAQLQLSAGTSPTSSHYGLVQFEVEE